MDRWTLKLQQYNIKFQHVAGKENVIADAISHLKTASLNEKPKDCEMSKTLNSMDNIMENLIFKIHLHSPCITNIPTNLDALKTAKGR